LATAWRQRRGVPHRSSGHELGPGISLRAAAIGGLPIERQISLDSSMGGSDQSASMEPREFASLVKGVRVLETAFGDGVKRVMPGEESKIDSLRKVTV